MPFSPVARSLKTRVKANPVLFVVLFVVTLGVLGAGLRYLEEDARTQKGLKPKDRSALSSINPFLAAPTPEPTPQLSKEYIYAGSRLLAVEDANANAAPPADLAVWRPSTGVWWVLGGPGSAQVSQQWGNGAEDDIPVPGDYDGDGKTDFSVFRPTDNKWYVIASSDSTISAIQWGTSTDGDMVAPADYDGDGKTDRAIVRPDDPVTDQYKWWIYFSSDSTTHTAEWGWDGDVPAPADYDGDGKADLAMWRNSNTNFYTVHSSDSSQHIIDFSVSGTHVSADYDGDGKANYAIRNGAAWVIMNAALTSTSSTTPSGDLSSDEPVPNDYDGDGKCDIAVWRPGTLAYWYIRKSGSSGDLRTEQWGTTGDKPVPAYYRR